MTIDQKEAARGLAAIIMKQKHTLYTNRFFRSMSMTEFDQAWNAAIAMLAKQKEDENART